MEMWCCSHYIYDDCEEMVTWCCHQSNRLLRQNSSSFMMEDIYRNPGPLQFEGSGADTKPISLCVEDQDYMGRIKKLQEYLEKVKSIVKPGCSQDVLKAAVSAMASVTEMLTIMSSLSFSGQATI
uniref:Pyrophosphate--fructose 6-phosphate 1-phosphotransferase subunit alpha 2 n=1 Tax=Zea mays TaxID=4577 RepID=A0A804R0E1_MAIZE